MSNNTTPVLGGPSPWGRIDLVTVLAEGIVSVSTPSHGGIWLSQERVEQIPEALRTPSPEYSPKPHWWEEDCEVTFPLWFFGAHIQMEMGVRPARRDVLGYMGYAPQAWRDAVTELQISPRCARCRGENIFCDATATWSVEKQNWELKSFYDNTDCDDCEGECRVFWVPSIAPRSPQDEEPDERQKSDDAALEPSDRIGETCHHLGPRIPIIQHERPTCQMRRGHEGQHGARVGSDKSPCWWGEVDSEGSAS